MNKNNKMIWALGVVLIVYVLLVIIIGGISGHDLSHWVLFALTIAITVLVGYYLSSLKKKHTNPSKLIFWGYSIAKWSVAYVLLFALITAIFMIIEVDIKIPIVLLVVISGAYCVIIIMCESAKEIIGNVRSDRAESTNSMDGLTEKLQRVAVNYDNQVIKDSLQKLVDKFVYSDSVSVPETADIESKMLSAIDRLDRLPDEDALDCIKQIERMLEERNIICKSSKRKI